MMFGYRIFWPILLSCVVSLSKAPANAKLGDYADTIVIIFALVIIR